MLFISRVLKLMLCLSFTILLSQCTKVPTESHVQVNKQLASPYTMPASAYLALAQNQAGSEKQSLLLMAAGRLIYDGQWQQGVTILSQIGTLTDELADEKNVLLAKVDLIREQPNSAIAKLSNVREINRLPIYYQVQFHEMLAYAYLATKHPVEAVLERIKLDRLLPDEASRANNRRALWLSLTTLSQPELDMLAAESSDNVLLDGWLQLAAVSRKQYNDSDSMLAELGQWQMRFPNHPANYILPTPLESIKQHLFAPPKHIALLLPVTGPLAGPGNAIKDGFMAAYEASSRRDSTNVHFYDANSTNIAALYQQALYDGADYIVGPLSKPDVAQVAKLDHPVPTVLLNDADGKVYDNAYQFGLSPSNEARQVAAKARKNGYSHALIIAPSGSWGDDVVNAFAVQWRAGGGQVVETLHYGPQDELTSAIRNMLHVSASEERKKPVKLAPNTVSEPKRRQDFDVIFLVAYPTKARQIMPLLRYYYAGDIPVYATSSVYSGSVNTMKDRDLNGIRFCDMPWVFSHQMGNRNWPEQFNSYNRLYALGMDSFALSSQLNQLLLFPALGVNDKSGVLYLNSGQQISRILVFGQFKQGVAQLTPS
ncbi:MAG: penicillin-binding protein activator [Legionellaceae bacterium]|nr:penicillin-binding protein activator [Legionellaceae bacterium]